MSEVPATSRGHCALHHKRAPFQFGVLDIVILLVLHAVAISGTMEIYQSHRTERNPSIEGMIDESHLEASGMPSPSAPVVVALAGDMRFTAFWFHKFVTDLIVGAVMILTAFLVTAVAVRGGGQHVRRSAPRLAAGIACLLFAAGMSLSNYLDGPEVYTKIDGQWVNVPIRVAWWVVGSATAMLAVIICNEFELWAKLRRRLSVVESARSNR